MTGNLVGVHVGFTNEGTVEIVLDGFQWHEVTDFNGEVLGEFSNWAIALGAQRDANIKMMVIRREAREAGAVHLYSCTLHFEDGITVKGSAIYDGRWFGPSDDHDFVLRKAHANGVAVPAFQ